MATQSVKFHSLTQSAYDSATKTDGGLYFISDNGEIRKGSKHVTGTRVYTAVDSSGTTAVESLDIEFNGTSISDQDFPTDDLPKKGDMLVVEHTLKAGVPAQGTEGEAGYVPAVPPIMEYAAYIYAANGGTYSASGWQACDGNVDASKVILTNDITMAGNYTAIGNFTKGSTSGKKTNFIDNDTKGTTGVSVYELIKQMLSKTVEPAINAYPSVSLTVTNTSYDVEYGSTVTPTYSVSYIDGNYKYAGGGNQTAGCARTAWVVTGVPDGTAGSGSTNSIIASNASQTLTVKAKATYAAGTNTPKNNLGDDSDIAKIPAGTTAEVSKTVTVTAYRKNFWIYFENSNMVDLGSMALDGTDLIPGMDNVAFDSDYIRANGHGQKSNFSSIPLSGVEFQQVLIFLPKASYENSVLTAKTENNLPYTVTNSGSAVTVNNTKRTIVIEGAGSDAGVEYCIWEIKPGTPVSGDVIALAWA